MNLETTIKPEKEQTAHRYFINEAGFVKTDMNPLGYFDNISKENLNPYTPWAVYVFVGDFNELSKCSHSYENIEDVMNAIKAQKAKYGNRRTDMPVIITNDFEGKFYTGYINKKHSSLKKHLALEKVA